MRRLWNKLTRFPLLWAFRTLFQRRPFRGVPQLKGCVQQARKWLFRPKFFSSSKWAQFLHVTLDLTGKRCPVIFSAVLFFVFEKFSSTSTGGKCALRWFYCLEKQKLSLERTPPGKKLRFCIRYLWKMKEKPANLNRGVCFSIKWKATCRNWAHLDEEKQFRPKKSLTSLLHAALQLSITVTKVYVECSVIIKAKALRRGAY